ncbi:hypothetical protein HDU98_003575 [Podochytrium sp. JEL0797]|nr:hypothetical protein HDU98_003575 [Podochytrium sp. JEL0797]
MGNNSAPIASSSSFGADAHAFLVRAASLFGPSPATTTTVNTERLGAPPATLETAFIAFQSTALLHRILFHAKLKPKHSSRKVCDGPIPTGKELKYLERLARAKAHSDRQALQPLYDRIMQEARGAVKTN